MRPHIKLILLYLSIFIVGSSEKIQNSDRPSITISKVTGEIIIDGDFTDPGWISASSTDDFFEISPGDNIKPPVETEVRLAYDEHNLYIAFLAYDNPENIRASYQNRDEAWSDDFVAIVLDPFGESNIGILVGSNPFGVQLDAKNAGRDDNPKFDLLYKTEGKITSEGYQVEMAIPFSSLSFPNTDEQIWRIGFFRSLPRKNKHQINWGRLDRTDPCWLCQLGYLKGIKGVQQSRKFELLPAMIASQSSTFDSSNIINTGPITAEPSLGIRYSFSSDFRAELTFNPDFSQIEADADQVDVNTTFALSYPEKRPFFNEGTELFKTWINAVYTRSINNPLAAGRIINRFGNTALVFLSALDEDTPFTVPSEEESYSALGGKSISNILRLKHSFGEKGYYGLLLTDRRLQNGGSGTLIGTDLEYRLTKNYRIELQVLSSLTEEPTDSLIESSDTLSTGNTVTFDGESFSGNAIHLELSRNTKHWFIKTEYKHLSPTFRAANGFISNNDIANLEVLSMLRFWPNRDILSEFRTSARASTSRNFDGLVKRKELNIWLNFVLPRQTTLRVELNNTPFERFKDIELKNMFSWEVDVHSEFSESLMFGIGIGGGENIVRSLDIPEKGRSQSLYIWNQIKLTKKLVVQPFYAFTKMETLNRDSTFYTGFLGRLQINYQYNRALSFRLLTQYSDFEKTLQIQPLVSYQPSPFTIFYIGTTQKYDVFNNFQEYTESDSQIFMKFQYLFDV